ncbi:Peptidase A1 domain-containing protein [Aphelenchoides bicaudatus]|nr:Peptidase A1 domain-containing protein [Aphelenchoides bicaudatus]
MTRSFILLALLGCVCSVNGFPRNNVESKSGVYEIPVSSSLFNVEYATSISIGSPPQSFNVIIDTASTMSFVPHKNYKSTGPVESVCENNEVYDDSKSSTSQKTGDNFDIKGSPTKGKYFKDVFAFGNGSNNLLKLKKPTKFGAADSMVCEDRSVLALGFSPKNDKSSNVVEEAISQGLLKHPMSTVFLKRCPPAVSECAGGVITLGKHDRKHCGAVIGTVKVDSQDPRLFFVDEASVGNYKHKKRVSVMSSTGTSHLVLGPTFFDNIIRETGAVQIYPGSQLYKVPCSKNIEIKFKINGVKYAVPLRELSVELANNECQIQIFRKTDDSQNWVLGAPFIRSVCHIYDYQNRVIAFAKPGKNQPGDEYTPEKHSGNKSHKKH